VRIVQAKVIEDRGPIGFRGRRLYGVRIGDDPDATTLEVPEDELDVSSDAVHRTMTYSGPDVDRDGMPNPLHHYLVVAKPGATAGAATASIISLSAARMTGMAQGPSQTIPVSEGGSEAALTKAEAYLDQLHPGLKKVLGETRGSSRRSG
jgi:hypothetical protein